MLESFRERLRRDGEALEAEGLAAAADTAIEALALDLPGVTGEHIAAAVMAAAGQV